MIKISYKIFGVRGELTETVIIDSEHAYMQVLKAHATSSKAFFWVPEYEFKLPFVKDGVIETFAYNKRDLIIKLLNSPEIIARVHTELPVVLEGLLKEALDS